MSVVGSYVTVIAASGKPDAVLHDEHCQAGGREWRQCRWTCGELSGYSPNMIECRKSALTAQEHPNQDRPWKDPREGTDVIWTDEINAALDKRAAEEAAKGKP